MRWGAVDEMTHIQESLAIGEFALMTDQKYSNGSTVSANGQEWMVMDMSRDADGLLAGQADRGADYNLYVLQRQSGKNTLTLLRWQHELDTENHK